MRMDIQLLHSLSDAQKVLAEDLRLIKEALRENVESQCLRRQLIRAFASSLEAHVFYLKRVVLFIKSAAFTTLLIDSKLRDAASRFVDMSFRTDELQLLRECNAEVNDSGTIRSSPKFIQVVRNIKFAQDCYRRALKLSTKLDYSNHGWSCLRNTVELRNKLTHPKSSEDLCVRDEDLRSFAAAEEWFVSATDSMLCEGDANLEGFLKILEDHAQRVSKSDLSPKETDYNI